MERFAIRGHICYSEDQKKIRTVDQGYVVCEDGKSRGVFETLPEEWRGIPCRDYGDKLIIPGLVDPARSRSSVHLPGPGDGPGTDRLAEHPHFS